MVKKQLNHTRKSIIGGMPESSTIYVRIVDVNVGVHSVCFIRDMAYKRRKENFWEKNKRQGLDFSKNLRD